MPTPLTAWYFDSTALALRYDPTDSEGHKAINYLFDSKSPGKLFGLSPRFSCVEVCHGLMSGEAESKCLTFEGEFAGDLKDLEETGILLFLDQIGSSESDASRTYIYQHPELSIGSALHLATFQLVIWRMRKRITRAHFVTVNATLGNLAVACGQTTLKVDTRFIDPRHLPPFEVMTLRSEG